MAAAILNALLSYVPSNELWFSLSKPDTSDIPEERYTIMHRLVQRGYSDTLEVVCGIFDEYKKDSELSDDNLDSIYDNFNFSLLDVSISLGHRKITRTLRPYFRREAAAVDIISMQLRRMLINRYLKKQKEIFKIKMNS